MLGRWSDEPGAALGIFPDGGDVSAEPFTSGSGLERRIGRTSLLRRAGIERGSRNTTVRPAPRMVTYATGKVSIVGSSLGSNDDVALGKMLRPLFDGEFYLRSNPDVRAAGMDPLDHYLKYGAAEQRQPHPLFDPVHYLACCPEARNAENPLAHFLRTNGGNWPATHPLFDCEAYANARPDASGNPLFDYLAEKPHRGPGRKPVRAMLKEAAAVRFVLLHYHFFKNAGSTIEEILAHSFFENYARLDTEDFDGAVSQERADCVPAAPPRMKAVSSHQFRYPLPQAPGFIFFDLCFLRDPLDRIRSMYDYFREKPVPGEPASELAREQSLGGFIAELMEHHAYRVSNVQVNLLANGVVNDPPAEADLIRATQVMLKTSFLGVVDCFEESLVAGQYFLRPVFPNLALAQQPANVSAGWEDALNARIEKFRRACDPDVFAELVRLNSLDAELVNRARAEVHRRFSMVPDGPARLRELRESGVTGIPRP